MSSKSKKLKKPFERGASRKSEEGQGGKNRGAYESPLSGVGVVHDSDWTIPPSRGVVIHECGYLEKNREWNFTWVFSPFWRLYFNTEPGHNVVIGNKVVELTQDRIVVIPPHRQFHCRSTRAVPSLWVHFSVSQKLSEKSGAALVFQPSVAEFALTQELTDAIKEVAAKEPTDRNFRLALALVLTVLARREIEWSPALPDHLLKAQKHLEENLASPLILEELAHAAGIGEPRLRADFKKFHGTTPSKYVAEIRVREAAALLFHTNKSLDEIAETTGFGTRFYMSRVFKKITGESPAAYRRKNRE
jgi:AraC-like DNA-binding protein